MKLVNIILQEYEYDRYKSEASELQKELQKTYKDPTIRVNMGYYSEDGPKASKGFGKVTFNQKSEVDPSKFKNLVNTLKAKGYEVTDQSNYFDQDNDRFWFPTISFEFDI